MIRFIAKSLGIPKANFVLLSGETSRKKRIPANGMGKDELIQNWQ
ncbi:MAG: hypothetical protein CMI26_10275 [Opitutae bacterium]|nr:hypothetical protein [Opitutae bacterium]